MSRLAWLVLVAAACKGSEPTPVPATTAGELAPAKPLNPTAELARLVELAKTGPDQDAYPQADAVVALERDDITLQPDGTVIERHRSVVKILDAQRGKDKFADIHIPFDARRQTLTLVTTRTINGDGKTHAASPDEIGDIVPPRLAGATIYSDVRERVVSFPAVDTGSVVELEYTRTTKPGPDSPMGGERMLAGWHPIIHREVTVTVPANVTPKLAVTGMTLAPVEASTTGGRTYTFTVKNLPDAQPESGSPVTAAVLPRVVFGFAPDWNHVVRPVADRFLRAAVPAVLPEAVKRQAEQLIAGAATDEDKARAIFKFVAHDIRSIDLPLGWAGYEPNAPDVVLDNRYGDDRDKVGLLLALASAAKLDGRPVLVRTGKVPVLESVPTVAQYDRMIAKLSIAGRDVWLDPSDEHGQFGVAFSGQDNLVLPLDRKGAEVGRRPALDPSTSVAHTTATFTLAANGDLDASFRHDLTGWYADRASGELRPLKGENLARFFQQSAVLLAPSAIAKSHDVGDTMSVSGPLQVQQRVSVPGYSEVQGGFRVFELPPSSLELTDDIPTGGLATRKYPLWIGTPRTKKEDISIALPAGWKVAHLPPALTGSASGVRYSSKCEATAQAISCHTEVALDQLTLEPDKYGDFRDAMTKLRAYERRIVLLTRA